MNQSPVSSTAQRGFNRTGNRAGMGKPVEKPKDQKMALKRLAAFFKPELKYVVLLALVVVFGVIASVIGPSLQSNAIDALVRGAFPEIPRILSWMLFVYILNGAATLLQGFLSARLSQRVIYRLRGELFAKVISLPIPWLDNHSHGDVMSRMTNDAENVSNVISSSLSSLFSGVLTLTGILLADLLYAVADARIRLNK